MADADDTTDARMTGATLFTVGYGAVPVELVAMLTTPHPSVRRRPATFCFPLTWQTSLDPSVFIAQIGTGV